MFNIIKRKVPLDSAIHGLIHPASPERFPGGVEPLGPAPPGQPPPAAACPADPARGAPPYYLNNNASGSRCRQKSL